MSDALYSRMEHAQYRGPAMSDRYNERVDKAYRDLVMLLNKIGLADEDAKARFSNLVKTHFSMAKALEDLKSRTLALESITELANGTSLDPYRKITFFNESIIDSDRFNGTTYEVSTNNRCSIDTRHGVMTLPKVYSSSVSKFGYTDSIGNFVVPATFETRAVGVSGTADSAGASISTSEASNVAKDEPGKVWERNVLAKSPNANGALVNLYVRVPEDLSITPKANAVVVHPYPMMGCDLEGVYTSSQQNINLSENDAYTALNSAQYYDNDNYSVGWSPPGSWNGDKIASCGPKIFYFDPKEVNALKVSLRQRQYFFENNLYIYSYGLSFLDLRYDKFLKNGKTILKLQAPSGKTFSRITDVSPQIYNVSEAEIQDVFSYRVIWETSSNSGTYTLNPVPLSNRVWFEVTLNETINGGTPSLSGLKVEYS